MSSLVKQFDLVVYEKNEKEDGKDFPRPVGRAAFFDNGNGIINLHLFPGLKIQAFPYKPKEEREQAPPKRAASNEPW